MFHSSGLLSHPNGLSSMYLAYTPSYPRLARFHFKLAISLQTGSIPWMKFPFLMGIHGKNNPVDEMSPFHPPALMPAGHKNRQALHRTGFGPKMVKKQPLPCQTCAAKAPPALTPGGHKNRQAPRPGPGPCKMIPRYVGPT